MNEEIHGGDIFDKEVELDFSVNINPLGMAGSVKKAVIEGIGQDETYPDRTCGALRRALAKKEQLLPEQILCGNGASELIQAAVRAAAPKNCAVAAPSFSGYERAVRAFGAEVQYYMLSADTGYGYETVCTQLEKMQVQMCFLCNPNNPIGNRIQETELAQILEYCSQKKIIVLVDECFLKFHKDYGQLSCKRFLGRYDNLLVLNAFTKFYAMAGIRLGYLMTSNESLLKQAAAQLSEWNVSSVAQRAGIAALKEKDYEEQTRQLVAVERTWMADALCKMGCTVFPSEADYMTFQLPQEKQSILLRERLLKEKILIRSCASYHHMPSACYRVAVRQHTDNERLVAAIQTILYGQQR